jgi:hypothetical protein
MCKSISVKSAVQKSAVGGAKNGGRGLEKKPYPLEMSNFKSFFLFFSDLIFLSADLKHIQGHTNNKKE